MSPLKADSDHRFIAHYRKSNGLAQSVAQHLLETATLAELFASVIGLPLCGRLLGLVHDFGKYSDRFQQYIQDICGLNGAEKQTEAKKKQGTIDHATSGAQLLWSQIPHTTQTSQILAQILSVVIMSHHSRSGMKDFVDLHGRSPFLDRLSWSDEKTHLNECRHKADLTIQEEIRQLLGSQNIIDELKSILREISTHTENPIPRNLEFALLTRFLFSCLLDADRISTIDFENPKASSFRTIYEIRNWTALRDKLEETLLSFNNDTEINRIRNDISEECRNAATTPENLLTLQVPTGGGKTLASLRFALHRAASADTHKVDRIIYILPYTSILDQNADDVRKILGDEAVLEHHSNLSEEKDTPRNRVLSENWDAPVVFTTTVQFLNSLFAAGTKSARRMHQLTNAILIFDEVQSLPIKTIHLFNNALQFLTKHGNTTAVLCTATMPLLQRVNTQRGALPLSERNCILKNTASLFKRLKRTEVIDSCRTQGWTNQEATDLALKLQAKNQSLLIICNTKKCANDLFDILNKQSNVPVIHLSTNMCPAHRKNRIAQIRSKLSPAINEPIICISTQLIEAGVNLDFGCVIRSLAGLDSIIQAAGRCNRHGKRETGEVHVLNLKDEKLYSALKEIEEAQQITKNRIFHEFKKRPEAFDYDLLSERAIIQYYEYYFYQRAEKMTYPCQADKGNPPLVKSCKILSLFSCNKESSQEAKRTHNHEALKLPLKQAHSTASQAFHVINAPTQGIIVPYDADGHSGSEIIGQLASSYTNDEISFADQVRLHKKAQQYTVNAFPHIVQKLNDEGAILEVQQGEGIYYLKDEYYHNDLGITLEALSEQNYLGAHT